MVMTFHTSPSTPLFTTTWAPSSSGAYAGTIVFLIVLGVIHRALVAHKAIQERVWLARDSQRSIIVASPDTETTETRNDKSALGKEGVVTGSSLGSSSADSVVSNGPTDVAKKAKADELSKRMGWSRAWRWSVDLPRAALTTLVSGVGYLL